MIGITQGIDKFTYSNIVETVLEYSPLTNYSFGDLARVGYYHYKSTFGELGLYNVGNDPLTTLGVNWYKYEPSNLYSCLDTLEETTTVWAGTTGIIEFERGTKNKLAIGNFNANEIKIEMLNSLGEVLSDYTQTFTFSNNLDVYDEWDYGYGGFAENFINVALYNIRIVGQTVRVTLTRNTDGVYLGYIVAGKAEDFGTTYGEVSFPDTRVGSSSVNTATFGTFIDTYLHSKTVQRGKQLIDTDMVFVIDTTENSVHQNIVILGKITKCDGVASNFDKNIISWTIQQNILT